VPGVTATPGTTPLYFLGVTVAEPTLIETAAALRDGSLTSVELVTSLLERIDAIDAELGAFTTVYRSTALAAAASADAALAAGTDLGPLHGIPFGIKDIIAAQEGPTSASSTVVKKDWWSGLDAPVVARLRAAGAVILGKTTTMEYALGEPDDTQGLVLPKCAWDLDRWAGGSSSGSGSGVAAGLMVAAIGTDTGGSVRLPAAFNGITGHKPTFGLVPKSGLHALGFTLDAVGPMAHTAADCAVILDVIAGYDESDPTSTRTAVASFSAELGTSLAGKRVGVDLASVRARAGSDHSSTKRYEEAIAVFEEAGAVIVPIELPSWQLSALSAMVTWQVDALNYHADTVRDHWNELGRGIRDMFIEGTLLTPLDYLTAQRARAVLRDELAALFADIDVIITPTVGVGALRFEERSGSLVDSTAYTSLFNVTGYPAISVPMGLTSDGVPLGLQIGARPFDDALAIGIADAYQQLTDHHRVKPPLTATLAHTTGDTNDQR